MALPWPQKGKPEDPRSEEQIQRELVAMRQNPDIGVHDMSKYEPGPLTQEIQKVGKK